MNAASSGLLVIGALVMLSGLLADDPATRLSAICFGGFVFVAGAIFSAAAMKDTTK